MSHDPASDGPRETRAVARLPGIDIAILYSDAQDARGERVTIMLEKAALPPFVPGDPVGAWLMLVRAAWAPWVAVTASLWGMPRILDRR
jgi:hypothetical protein